MKLFNDEWEKFNSMNEYEFRVGCKYDENYHDYDKSIFSPIHEEDEYDSMEEYESGIKHFQDE